MLRFLKIFKWIFIISIIVSLLTFTNNRQKKQLIKLNKITILNSEDSFVNYQIVVDYLHKNGIDFDNVLVVDFNKEFVEIILKQHNAIKTAEVFVNQKGFLNIDIVQKHPIVHVKSNTSNYYLDEFGKKMNIPKHYLPRLPLVTGNVLGDHYKEIVAFVNEINNSKFWTSQLTQIHIENDDVILIPRVGSHKIHLGDFTDYKTKLENLYLFYKKALPKKGWQTYSNINLKFNNQIVCRKK